MASATELYVRAATGQVGASEQIVGPLGATLVPLGANLEPSWVGTKSCFDGVGDCGGDDMLECS